MSIRMLVSVRSVDEALLAARGGADFIDLKEPGQGALGGLPLATIRAIVAALRGAAEPVIARLPISATIGDVAMREGDEILRRVRAVAACGVDYVKVGITREPQAGAVLQALAGCGHPVVPVFVADLGLDADLLGRAGALGFPGLMADTADKLSGSLFDRIGALALHTVVAQGRSSGAMVGLAGALRLQDLPLLRTLAPDFAGFRSAVCAGDRSGALDPARLAALARALRGDQAPRTLTSPSSSERMAARSLL